MVPSLAPNVRDLKFKSLPNVIYTFHNSDTDTVTVFLNLLLRRSQLVLLLFLPGSKMLMVSLVRFRYLLQGTWTPIQLHHHSWEKLTQRHKQ
jgi:hypothetical protein